MPPSLLVGVDLGTSGTKALLLDPEGDVLGLAAKEYPLEMPHAGWAEQNPEIWYQAATETMGAALAQAGASGEDVAAIGFSGQMHGTVCLDNHGRVLRPAIVWPDQRSQHQVERLRREVGDERLGEWTGNPVATGFMLPSWLWLRENEPKVAGEARHLLLPKDYVRYRFTGELGSEPSDASSTGLFDPKETDWSEALLSALQIDPGLLPQIYASAEVAGRLLPEAARDSGLRPGTPVVYGGGDQACQALGSGIIDPGVASCTIGTGGQILAPLLSPAYDPQLRLHLYCHALPERWFRMAAILSAGLALKWLRDQVLVDLTYQEMADLAAGIGPGAEGLFFLPYLAGERTPHMDPQARGGFIGLTLRHGRAHLVRAVMEGVVFALRQGLELILELGVPVERVLAAGGATNHPLWLQLQADIFNRPVYRTWSAEAAALGAALLAGVGVGVFPDARSACSQVVRLREEVVSPNGANTALYREAYLKYCEIYPRIKGLSL
ncbi:MAG TPA: xylulokinase [Anaerolineales bacterium]|nr:xylulokinase [Anaerolineales bacterium]